MNIDSQGVTGLVASLEVGSFDQHEGLLEFNVIGTPQDYGTAMFYITIDNKTCVIEFDVSLLEDCEDYQTILSIDFNNEPQHTYWELYSTNDSSTPIYSGGLNGSYVGLTSLNVPMCLESGDFVLTFYDTNGNGAGVEYSLSDSDGNQYACGGYFTYNQLNYFTSGENYPSYPPEEYAVGNYLIEEITPYRDGPTLNDGAIVSITSVTGNPSQRTFDTPNYINYCSTPNAFTFELDCGRIFMAGEGTQCNCSCGGNLWFTNADTPTSYDPADDSMFEVSFTNDAYSDCAAPQTTTYRFTKQ
jgi:hypothetical protein